ncbi:hypothetical protein PT7_0276 [Pusillimonas sp. T7-7]|nr:hypothetical protein PT7_0276 [Pusillimonas sp. T7-7]
MFDAQARAGCIACTAPVVFLRFDVMTLLSQDVLRSKHQNVITFLRKTVLPSWCGKLSVL